MWRWHILVITSHFPSISAVCASMKAEANTYLRSVREYNTWRVCLLYSPNYFLLVWDQYDACILSVYSLLKDPPETWWRWSQALRCLSCAAQSMWRLCWTSPESCWVVAWRPSTSQSCPSRSVSLERNFLSCPWLSESTAGTPRKLSLISCHQYLSRKNFLLLLYFVCLI